MIQISLTLHTEKASVAREQSCKNGDTKLLECFPPGIERKIHARLLCLQT
jgi:hypothetical protein